MKGTNVNILCNQALHNINSQTCVSNDGGSLKIRTTDIEVFKKNEMKWNWIIYDLISFAFEVFMVLTRLASSQSQETLSF